MHKYLITSVIVFDGHRHFGYRRLALDTLLVSEQCPSRRDTPKNYVCTLTTADALRGLVGTFAADVPQVVLDLVLAESRQPIERPSSVGTVRCGNFGEEVRRQ